MRIVKKDPVLSIRGARRALHYMLASPGLRHVYDDAVSKGFNADFAQGSLTVHNSDEDTVEFYDKDGVFMFSKENHRVAGRALTEEDGSQVIDGIRLRVIHR